MTDSLRKLAEQIWIAWQEKEGVRHHTYDDWPIRFALYFASHLQPQAPECVDAYRLDLLRKIKIAFECAFRDWPESEMRSGYIRALDDIKDGIKSVPQAG